MDSITGVFLLLFLKRSHIIFIILKILIVRSHLKLIVNRLNRLAMWPKSGLTVPRTSFWPLYFFTFTQTHTNVFSIDYTFHQWVDTDAPGDLKITPKWAATRMSSRCPRFRLGQGHPGQRPPWWFFSTAGNHGDWSCDDNVTAFFI